MSSSYGKNIRITLFGQSHGPAIGVVIEGLPPGFAVDMPALQRFMARRAPGGALATARKEPDEPEFVSGLYQGKTCGAPLVALICNQDARSADYEDFKNTPRPGHADFTAGVKYNNFSDFRGGGHFSGRLTAPLCLAGAFCLQLLEKEGIAIGSHIAAIGQVPDAPFDAVNVNKNNFTAIENAQFPVNDEQQGLKMRALIEQARSCGNSVGGVIECAAVGLPAGLGDPMTCGMENRIAAIAFSIPGIKGIEFGSGFAGCALWGSQNNDAFCFQDGAVRTRSNHHGGILGGITSGMPLVFRVAVKPTPSIACPQDSVDLKTGQPVQLSVGGRHDPCIVPRALPCVEAAAAIAVYDALLEQKKYSE